MKLHAYCCFLPDLTRFTRFHCVGPNYQHYLPRADYTTTTLLLDFNPATAGCRLQGTATTPSSTAKINQFSGGESGTRTRGAMTALHAFQACPLANSDISPHLLRSRLKNLCNSSFAVSSKTPTSYSTIWFSLSSEKIL